MLKFSPANAKLARLQKTEVSKYLKGRKVYSLDLLSGRTCPYAKDCRSMVVMSKGKARIKDSPHCKYRCFSASQEAVFSNVYKLRKHNLDKIRKATQKGWKAVRDLILSSIPSNCGVVRLHVGGDFFNSTYLRGMVEATKKRQDILWYAYTKSIPYFQRYKWIDKSKGILKPNFLVTYSGGGKCDHLIPQSGVRKASVVYSENTSLPIDHNDSHAATPGGDFALLLHGTQPANSKASKAVRQLKGKGSYRRGE